MKVKKFYSRMLGCLSAIVLLINLFVQYPFSMAVFSTEASFDIMQYKARLYSSEDQIPYKTIVYYCDETISPATELADIMDQNVLFSSSIAAWKLATFEPEDATKYYVDEVGYYETIIFKSLFQYMESETVKNTIGNDYLINSQELYLAFEDALERKFGLDYNSLKLEIEKSPTTYEGQILDSFDEAFKKTYPKIEKTAKFLEVYGDIIKVLGIGEKGINNFASYMSCYNISESMKSIVYSLRDQCDMIANPSLKTALNNVAIACQSQELVWAPTAFDVSLNGFQFVYGKALNVFFDDVLSAEPFGLGVVIGRAITKPIVNIAFSTDEICEQYFKLHCLRDYEELVKMIVKQEIDNYRNTPSPINAENMFSSVELFFMVFGYSCEMAIDYAKIVYTQGVAGISSDNQKKYLDYSKNVQEVKNIMESRYKNDVSNYWSTLMKYEYPEIWEELFDPNKPISVESVSFEKESATIDLQEFKGHSLIYDGVIAVSVSPENATNRKVSYTTSDKTVVDIESNASSNNYLWIRPISVGKATITVTTEDGGYSDTIDIKIIDTTNSNETQVYEAIPSEKIYNSGKCGDNIKWTLTTDGALIINGTGKMHGYYASSLLSDSYNSPWYIYCERIKEVRIMNGVSNIGAGAFYSCRNLTNITIPDSVTSIDSYAFSCCESLKSITIPNSVRRIENDTFERCSSLNNLTIPNSVEYIGSYAFNWCSSLTNITFSKNLSYIGSGAFWMTPWLTSQQEAKKLVVINGILIDGRTCTGDIIIPNTVKCINEEAFCNCKEITSVIIPEGVTNIGSSAFACCSNLSNISIPQSIVHIGEDAFDETSWLYSKQNESPFVIVNGILIDGSTCEGIITIPETVKCIGDGAFKYCENLTSVIIPNGVTNIGDNAFYNSSPVTPLRISISNTVVNIGKRAFTYRSLTRIDVSERNPVYCSIDGVLFTKDKECLITYPASREDENYTIPDTVSCIGEHAFEGAYLSNITVTENLKQICDYAFEGCINIKAFTFPESITNVGGYVLARCTNLKKVVIPENVKSIGYGAFKRCLSLNNVFISANVHTIDPTAFFDCDNLTDIYYAGNEEQWNKISIRAQNTPLYSATIHPDNICLSGVIYTKDMQTLISYSAGKKDKIYEIPNGVKYIHNNAFEECINLTRVTIPKSVESIGEYAFYDCRNLTSVSISNNIKTIGECAFARCSNIRSFVYPKRDLLIRDYVFSGCENLKSITIPDHIISIGKSAFSSCNSLSDVYYTGNQDKWISLSIEGGNAPLTSSSVHFMSSVQYGDCNNDGEVSTLDIILLQKWILSKPNITIINNQAADLNEDDEIDIIDLGLLKRKLLS